MELKQPKIAIYLRVSTQEQSCELQRQECLNYCQSRNWSYITIYEDTGISGTHSNRPALKRLLNDIRAGQVQLLICWKMCRLFRSLKDLVFTLQELSERNIGFLALKDQIDLTTSSGRLLMHLLGAFSEFEASLIRERVKSGLDNARRKGRRLGRPPEIDLIEAKALKSQGLSLSAIANSLGASKSGVHKTLSKQAS